MNTAKGAEALLAELKQQAGGHPAPYAYCGMELAIERLFNKCVADNKDYFMYYTGVPQSM